ncbi:MAG: hypothetical protein EOO38_01570, partial [Cytophagaceae bacterium]
MRPEPFMMSQQSSTPPIWRRSPTFGLVVWLFVLPLALVTLGAWQTQRAAVMVETQTASVDGLRQTLGEIRQIAAEEPEASLRFQGDGSDVLVLTASEAKTRIETAVASQQTDLAVARTRGPLAWATICGSLLVLFGAGLGLLAARVAGWRARRSRDQLIESFGRLRIVLPVLMAMVVLGFGIALFCATSFEAISLWFWERVSGNELKLAAPPHLARLSHRREGYFAFAGAATDGFISGGETASPAAMWSLSQSGATSVTYTSVLADTGGSLVCDSGRSYDQTAIAIGTDLTSDGAYSICVKLVDSLGNITFGKAPQVVRGTSGPIFASLTPINQASDGFINDTEKAFNTAAWALSQSGGTVIEYTVPINDASGSLICDASQTYSGSTIPRVSDLPSDGSWVICVKLTDAIANTSYGKAIAIVRDTVPPVFISLNNINAASDGYIVSHEILLINPLWALVASGNSTAFYSLPADDSGAGITCNGSITFPSTNIPSPSTLNADGTFASCVKLSDAAGNITFGKSGTVERNTVAPIFTGLTRANAGADGYVNDSEKTSSLALYSLTASGYATSYFTTALDDTGGALVCDSTRSYGASTIVTPLLIPNDGTYAVCVELTSAAGNKTYGKSAQIVRDTLAPTFTSLTETGDGADGIINNTEKLNTSSIWALTQSDATTIAYSLALDDSGGSLICDAGKTYGQSLIPSASSLGSDGPWALCAKLTDTAGNASYGKSSQINRSTSGPTVSSFAAANAATDGYINNSEKLLSTSLWTLSATGQTTTFYSLALNDSGGTLVCDQTKTYGQSTIPIPSDLSTDGPFALCVKLGDASGNITYGKSGQVVRDTAAPSFTAMALANGAADGFVNAAEMGSSLPLFTLTASGYTTADYSPALVDSALVCDASRVYGNPAIPLINSLSTDGAFASCVTLIDAAGNITYGKSAQVVRASAAPVFTALALANAASDGFINNAEKSLTTSLWTLTASGQTATSYTAALVDTAGTVVCNGSQTYSQATIPRPVDLTTDDLFTLCVRLTDASGNTTYGKAAAVARDVIAPALVGLSAANEASDGYLNAAEKNSMQALYSLTATGSSNSSYTLASNDSAGVLICDAGKTYSESSIPLINTLTTDGTYAVCVKLSDAAGNIYYGKSAQVIRNTNLPTFVSLVGINAGADGIVNDSEKSLNTALWSLTQSGASSIAYTSPLDDTGAVSCDSGKAYSLSSIALASDLTSDKPWIICVKLTDVAGNVVYGKSSQIVRDTTAPIFSSLSLDNAASDGFISDSEKLLTASMWLLTATGHSTAAYTLPLNDASGTLTCDVAKTYGQSTIAGPSSLATDGTYVLCVKLSDAAGNISYGKSSSLARDIVAPTFTSMIAANEASDGFISDAEKTSSLPLYTLSAAGHTAAAFTAGLSDSGGSLLCDASKSYLNSVMPLINSLSSDGLIAVCVQLTDTAGNKTFGKSTQVSRTTTGPSLTSLSGANAAADGYINDAEKSLTTALWSLSQTGATIINYTLALDDTGSSVSCDISKTYNQSTIARPVDLATDRPWVICVRLEDASGNVTFGKSSAVVRDIVAPTFTSLARANAGSDGYVSDSEKLLVNSLWALTASGQATTAYSTAQNDVSGVLTCDAAQTYAQLSIATPSSLSSDGTYGLCVKLSDTAGNITFGKSSLSIVRDIVAPTFTTLWRANEASDGYINNSEKTSSLALYTLAASDYTVAAYTVAASDSPSAIVCDASKTYSQSSIPLISSLLADGTYAVCASLTDDAGNKIYGKSNQVIRATTVPVFASLARANAASDGFINDSEKLFTTAMWSLSASGQTTTSYSLPLADASGTLACDGSQT